MSEEDDSPPRPDGMGPSGSLFEDERRKLKRRLEQQQLVHSVSYKMRSHQDLESISNHLTEAVAELTSFRNAFLMVLDGDGRTLRGVTGGGHRRAFEIGARLSKYSIGRIEADLQEQEAYMRALETGEVIFHRTRNDIVSTLSSLTGINPGIIEIIRRTTRMNLGITVPLSFGSPGGDLVKLGILAVSSIRSEVDPEDMKVLSILANQVSLALYNIRLLEDMKGQAHLAEASETRIRNLMDSTHDMICSLSPTGGLNFTNQAFRGSGVYSGGEIFDQETMDRVHPDDQPSVVAAYLSLKEGEPVTGLEYRIQDGSDNWLYHNLNAAAVREDEGTVQEIVLSIRDVTFERRRELQVIKRNKELEVLNDLITNLTSTLEVEETIQRSLTIVADFTDADMLALISREHDDPAQFAMQGQLFIPEEHLERLTPQFWSDPGVLELLSEDEVTMIDDISKLPPKHYHISLELGLEFYMGLPVSCKGLYMGHVVVGKRGPVVLDDDDLAILRAVGDQLGLVIETARMMTEIDRNSSEIEDRRLEAEFYLDLMGHDLSNLNQGALTSLELLETTEGLDERALSLVMAALRQVRAAAVVIERVQTLSALKRKLERPELAVTDLMHSLRQGMQHASGLCPEREVRIEVGEVEGCPHVMADDLLEQVFSNVLENAVKFNRGEQPEASVEIAATELQGLPAWRVSITDRGIGIPDERKRFLFRRFETGLEDAHGTGLGLTIAKAICDLYGGSITIEDRVKGDYSGGSVFNIVLPAAEPSE